MVAVYDSSVSASVLETTSPPVFSVLTRLKSLQGSALPLWPVRCSVYASPLLFAHAAVALPLALLRERRNTRYGWVVSPFPTRTSYLVVPSKSPSKKHQAYLGAPLTNAQISSTAPRRFVPSPPSLNLPYLQKVTKLCQYF